jgi:hypothetical protein
MKLNEPKTIRILITYKKNSLYCLAGQHKKHTTHDTNENKGQTSKPKLESNMEKHKHKISSARSPIDLVYGGACHRANERATKQDSLTTL